MLGISSSAGRRVLETLWFESESQKCPSGSVCLGHVVSGNTLGPLGQPEKAMGHESQIEPWSPLEHRSALLASELNRLRR